MKARGRPPKAAEPAEETVEHPKAVRLLRPYAYFTDTNVLRAWDADHVETDPGEIADLIRRGAHIEETAP